MFVYSLVEIGIRDICRNGKSLWDQMDLSILKGFGYMKRGSRDGERVVG